MKKLFVILILTLSNSVFSQGNFTNEWTSPSGLSFEALIKLNTNSDVLSILFTENANENNVSIYNGATHALTNSWTLSATFPSYTTAFNVDNVSAFDCNGDGVNEIRLSVSSTYKIVNPLNGNVLYTAQSDNIRISDVDDDGYVEIVEISNGVVKITSTPAQTVSVNNQNELIKSYELKQNYPNPFNPNTTIEYSLTKSSNVKIIVYDNLGKEVNTLVDQRQFPGVYKLNLNASGLASGTYFYSLVLDGIAESKKMILLK